MTTEIKYIRLLASEKYRSFYKEIEKLATSHEMDVDDLLIFMRDEGLGDEAIDGGFGADLGYLRESKYTKLAVLMFLAGEMFEDEEKLVYWSKLESLVSEIAGKRVNVKKWFVDSVPGRIEYDDNAMKNLEDVVEKIELLEDDVEEEDRFQSILYDVSELSDEAFIALVRSL